MSITYRKLTEEDLDVFIRMRIAQLREEGAKEDVDLAEPLTEYYHRHLADGTFVSWLALDEGKIVGTSGMSFVEKPPYFSCPSGRIGKGRFTEEENEEALKDRIRFIRDICDTEGVDILVAGAYGCGCVQITASDAGVLLYTDFGFRKNGNFMQYKL